MLFWSGKPHPPAQGLEGVTMRVGGEFGKSGDNARRREKRGAALVCSPGTNDANLPCKSRHISRHRAAEGRSCASQGFVTLSHPMFAYPPPALVSLWHCSPPFCGSVGGGWKVFRVVIPGVIAPRVDDESKIPRCKCDRYSFCGPSTVFRLFAQPGLLRIYQPPFRKLLWKFVNIGEIFMHVRLIINDCIQHKVRKFLISCRSIAKLNNFIVSCCLFLSNQMQFGFIAN